MSYYGYPNPGTYGTNYQHAYAQYAAAANASGGFDQYQAAAAYNAAAYKAIQQTQTSNNSQQNSATGTSSITSISQPAQRYDYTQQNRSIQNTNKTLSSSSFYSNFQKAGTAGTTSLGAINEGNKWLGIKSGQPLTRRGGVSLQFKQKRTHSTGSAQVPIFYCEVCKISCAGPQTYKEHTDGQKHKKREQASKINEQQKSLGVESNNNTNASNQIRKNNSNNGVQSTVRSGVVIKCDLCDVSCTGRDAYTAHVRGMKHQKTLKLHQKLGKPIPPDAYFTQLNVSTPTIPNSSPVISAPPSVNANKLLTTSSSGVSNSKNNLNSPPKVNLIATGSDLKAIMNDNSASIDQIVSTQTLNDTEEIDPNNGNRFETIDDGDYSNLEPIGKEYIETRLEGKILSFYCKLCECQFNDPNAKDMHTKGRRHRLAYKKKVDPSLKIDLKGGLRNSKLSSQSKQGKLLKLRGEKDKSSSKENQVIPIIQSNIGNFSNNKNESNSTQMISDGNLKPLMAQTVKDDVSQSKSIQQLMEQNLNTNAIVQNQILENTQLNQRNKNESFEDRHIIAKHNTIYPTNEEINAIQEIVTSIEKALKLVSDQIADEDMNDEDYLVISGKNEALKEVDPIQREINKQKEVARTLKGLMRVGLLAKGLLLRGDTDVKLILVCSNIPTKKLLERVYKILLEKIEIASPNIKYNILLDKDAEAILVVKMMISEQIHPLITCKILLTSPLVRTNAELLAEQQEETLKLKDCEQENILKNPKEKSGIKEVENTAEYLNKERCLESLAELRHAKWFQAVASQTPNCVLIIRILRDLCHRNPTWAPLTQWGLELLVERSLTCCSVGMTPGESLRRVLECVSSGVLLPNGMGLYDPCEKEATDLADNLKNQQREELTASAQMALRLLAFKQIYKILGMDKLEFNPSISIRLPKKRQNQNEESELLEKKEKKEVSEKSSINLINQTNLKFNNEKGFITN